MAAIKQPSKNLLLVILGIVILNIVGSYFYKRFDLTQDHRFTLSTAAKSTIATLESPIFIEVFLEGDFPSEFKRLQAETKHLLEEFEAFNPNIKYQFINPSDIARGVLDTRDLIYFVSISAFFITLTIFKLGKE